MKFIMLFIRDFYDNNILCSYYYFFGHSSFLPAERGLRQHTLLEWHQRLGSHAPFILRFLHPRRWSHVNTIHIINNA